MGVPVESVASGGLPVIDTTATTKSGLRVTEVIAVSTVKRGLKVTKVTNYGLPVVYASPLP